MPRDCDPPHVSFLLRAQSVGVACTASAVLQEVAMTKSKTPNKTSTVKSKLSTDTEISDLELDKVAGGTSTGEQTVDHNFSSGGGGGSGKVFINRK
jgi:hypothetical protein